MVRILDRYLVKEVALPFILSLTVLTFILEVQSILTVGEEFIARGVEWSIVVRVLITLLPQALCLTIPMAVLMGILVGFSRLSADREFVAMQACGVSLMRLARPVLLIATLGTAATAYETIVALPDANQTFREIVFVLMAERVESNVKPGVFFQEFAPKVLYVRETRPEGGWRDVFVADTGNPNETIVTFAKEGRIHLDRDQRLVQLELTDVTTYTTRADKPDDYEQTFAASYVITLDPDTVFRRPPSRGAREMTYAELNTEIEEAKARNDPAYEAHFMRQQKLSLPLTCPVLALIGLALGVTNRKDGKLASFALGAAVIFIYYVLLWGARAAAQGGRFNPELAPWTPNIIMGVAALVMLAWRARFADRPIRFSLPAFWRRRASTVDAAPLRAGASPLSAGSSARPRVVVVIRVPHLNIPSPKLLDVYLSREYLKVLILGIVSLLGLFYISTFIDLVDKLLRGETTGAILLRFFYFRTPQFVYYVIPMSVLVSVLVTIGVMTKNGELLVMRACGISLYRTAIPLLLFGAAASGVLYVMQERVLTTANREADRLERQIRGRGPATTALDRRWMVGTRGELYHYDFFDQATNRFANLLVYQLDPGSWQLRAITRAADVVVERQSGETRRDVWKARSGWSREMPVRSGARAPEVTYSPFAERELTFDDASYFKTDEPIADLMTYRQLSDYIARLGASGANVIPQMVALQRKVAFPFVTVIMTLLAVPFAVTTGRRGAMYGVGIGIVLAISYWVMMSVSGALGAGGVLPPLLAAWTPNILFGAAAAYMVLTVRT
jgi:LPS export ABC transporter permease LptF/LPS export ABC transporter permease LptG